MASVPMRPLGPRNSPAVEPCNEFFNSLLESTPGHHRPHSRGNGGGARTTRGAVSPLPNGQARDN
jgi:hypothetical protein